MKTRYFPAFVRRGMTTGRCQHCLSSASGCVSSHCGPFYGGLEPLLSANIGNALITALQGAKESRPSDIAYASLHSFALGSRPPLIRSIEYLGTTRAGNPEYKIDVDVQMEDLNIVIGESSWSLNYTASLTTGFQT